MSLCALWWDKKAFRGSFFNEGHLLVVAVVYLETDCFILNGSILKGPQQWCSVLCAFPQINAQKLSTWRQRFLVAVAWNTSKNYYGVLSMLAYLYLCESMLLKGQWGACVLRNKHCDNYVYTTYACERIPCARTCGIKRFL